jgi:hypothetical protein
MKEMTNDLWSLLTQVINAAHKFTKMSYSSTFKPTPDVTPESNSVKKNTKQNIGSRNVSSQNPLTEHTLSSQESTLIIDPSASLRTNAEKETSQEFVQKETHKEIIIISNTVDSYATALDLGAEELQIFSKSIPIEDQILLLKEGTVICGVVLTSYIYNEQHDSMIYQALKNQLYFGVNMSIFKGEPMMRLMDESFTRITRNFKDILRSDFFVITCLNLIMFFHETDGLSCNELIIEERKRLVKLLDIYIKANVESNRFWTTLSYESVWNNLRFVIKEFEDFKVKQVYELYEQQRLKNRNGIEEVREECNQNDSNHT